MPARIPVVAGDTRVGVADRANGGALGIDIEFALQLQVIKVRAGADRPFVVNFDGDTGRDINGLGADLG